MKTKQTKVYLAEITMGRKLEPIGIFRRRSTAEKHVGNHVGLISELTLNTPYLTGIGIANHWHINDTTNND